MCHVARAGLSDRTICRVQVVESGSIKSAEYSRVPWREADRVKSRLHMAQKRGVKDEA